PPVSCFPSTACSGNPSRTCWEFHSSPNPRAHDRAPHHLQKAVASNGANSSSLPAAETIGSIPLVPLQQMALPSSPPFPAAHSKAGQLPPWHSTVPPESCS